MNVILNHETQVIDLGLMDYHQAWDYQSNLHNSIIQIKKQNRSLSVNNQVQTKNYLLFCEHPAVYTLGKSGDEKNLLINNGVDTSQFTLVSNTKNSGVKRHFPADCFVIGTVGRIQDVKNHTGLIDAFIHLRETLLEHKEHLRLCKEREI